MGGRETRPLPPASWLLERIALFEAYCLPTIISQTDQNFDWLIFFDPEADPAGLEAFRALIAPYPNIHLRFVTDWTKPTIVNAVRADVDPDIEWLVTTRLDNDDGWHEQFAEKLHAQVRPGTRELLNYTQGYIVSQNRAYHYQHMSNAFISFSEPLTDFNTPFAIGHELLAILAPIRQIAAPPIFYQVVHCDNFSNKIRGTRVPIRVAREGFKNLRHALPDEVKENALSISIENATLGAVRGMRDTLINLYKRVRGRLA